VKDHSRTHAPGLIRRSSDRLRVAGIDTPARDNWTRPNTVLGRCSALALVGAIEFLLFGGVWSHGLYGSRMAWFLGVVLPLLAGAAGLAWAAARYGFKSGLVDTEGIHDQTNPRSHHKQRSRRSDARAVGVISLVFDRHPLALAGLLLVPYGLLFVSRWLR
jgi:hypothetical protein